MSFLLDYVRAAEARHEAGDAAAWGAGIHVPFAGRLDLQQGVGIVGHSFGAATAVTAARQDPRISACVAHDLWMLPLSSDFKKQGLRPRGDDDGGRANNPFSLLITQSRKWTEWGEQNREMLAFTRASGDATLIDFPATAHSNYSDVPLFAPMLARKMGQIGAADFRQAMNDINEAQTEFLVHKMQEQHSSSSNGSSNGGSVTAEAGQAAKKQFEALLGSGRAVLLARSGEAAK